MRCKWWWDWVWIKGEVKWTGVRVRWEVKVGFRVINQCRVWGDEYREVPYSSVRRKMQ